MNIIKINIFLIFDLGIYIDTISKLNINWLVNRDDEFPYSNAPD